MESSWQKLNVISDDDVRRIAQKNCASKYIYKFKLINFEQSDRNNL